MQPPAIATPSLPGEEGARGSQKQPRRQQASKEVRNHPKRDETHASDEERRGKEEGGGPSTEAEDHQLFDLAL